MQQTLCLQIFCSCSYIIFPSTKLPQNWK